MSAAGFAGLNSQPCISEQPSARSISRCCSVSTPSAVVIMLRAAAIFTTALHDAGGSLRLGDVVDEAAVDLDLVERETLQVAQRGIAGAEIVERDAHPDGAKLVQDGERGLVVADQHRLGDLQFEPARRQAGGGKRGQDLQREGAAPELDRRNVDREADIVGPGRGLRAGRGQHPFAELIDQAGVFRDRNELGGRDHAAFGVAPAQQRFAAGDAVVAKADAGLVVNLERRRRRWPGAGPFPECGAP